MYTVYMPKNTSGESTVLTLRVSSDLSRRLTRAAHARRRTRGQTARDLLEAALSTTRPEDPAIEARRQSILASRAPSERDALEFIVNAADIQGWE